ncbi:glycine dehydrogenase [Calocera viscosa TUFC12733]|uniref:Glycine cleavage system P protein n=1 Tax=Calocera viscosa (strain TUFC12733) TaxID=1330018 RepID=A0A167LSU6_CALVF|nr:glycine dehydrogenase [Calocera viscosa TUFC12733]
MASSAVAARHLRAGFSLAARASSGASRLGRVPKRLSSTVSTASLETPLDVFTPRHIGPRDDETIQMLKTLGYNSLEDFVHDTTPAGIRVSDDNLTDSVIKPLTEAELDERIREIAGKNKVLRSFIGMGYWNAVVPKVILRNITENPAWYTSYTPYQPEIAQGRLESLLNFQTMVTDLTGLDVANASLLDEATAAGEAMIMCLAALPANNKKRTFLVDSGVFPQTVDVLYTRALGFGVKVVVADAQEAINDPAISDDLIGVLVQYPSQDGSIIDYSDLTNKVHGLHAQMICATDLLALTLIKAPGEWGADIALGSSARFGVPAGYGGPHAAFFAVKDKLKRKMPGRLVGVSKDTMGHPAFRLALQTREQHIKREKATSNICTSQVLLANMAAMYAVYHGPKGLKAIAERVQQLTQALAMAVSAKGYKVTNSTYFDTLTVEVSSAADVMAKALEKGINLRKVDETHVGITLDESARLHDITALASAFDGASVPQSIVGGESIPSSFLRTSPYLTHPTFNAYHSETALLRYIYYLQAKDLSLVHAMIPLGSCTMKLNPTSTMAPLTWPELGSLHPFVPEDQAKGYHEMIKELEDDLCAITGFKACSLQPNSGASGEYAGLMVIREYLLSIGQGHRTVCLIPVSAHGTNPASAIMAGMKVVSVKVLANGNLDLVDLREKADKYKDSLAAFMITYPSTYGVFEDTVTEACKIIHEAGAQVYLDGANLNAQVGITNPATCGGDVCHLNLHKTFAIPHGGGGPGVGPICVAEHLAPFLPGHSQVKTGGSKAMSAVSAAPYGSASILSISWAYIKMLGGSGLKTATSMALLNANYIAKRLEPHYYVKFKNGAGRVAHEVLIELAEFDKKAGLKVSDFAKRLQDYGFHPPTCSWPLSTCMLIEPTESEDLQEIDKFCDAMIQIRQEAEDIITGKQPKENNLLKNAPHPMSVISLSEEEWNKPYSRATAAYPLPYLKIRKFWPSVTRIDDAYGDLNLMCTCPSVEEMEAKF